MTGTLSAGPPPQDAAAAARLLPADGLPASPSVNGERLTATARPVPDAADRRAPFAGS
ncbi:hypothetical protein AB0I22_20795 [Streptomyces sp. NPDC050610]|uniref:hypothetical protein n=1 Tax=Streptomyces sp. NPDC050610 TaxID=3157097 RepID=UPI003442D1DD